MKRMGKILSLFLTAAMAASCLAGCNNSDENADTSSAGSKPSSSTDYDIYIYNSKGETRNSSRPCARPIPRKPA